MALTVQGIDFAWGRPPYREAQRAGIKFVMRYISHDASKDLSGAELREWSRRGISVGVVFESTASRAAQGRAAGAADATYAKQRLIALGAPARLPVYFAVDFDPSNLQLGAVIDYLQGASGVLGKDRTGVYGGYGTIATAAHARVCRWFWQTYAWSGGRVHPATHIYQYRNGVRIGGVSCDLNHARDNGPYGVTGDVAPVSRATRRRRIWTAHLKDAVKKDGALHRRIAKLKRLVSRKKRAAQK
jgi:hypothetical protein